jgi:hypothetical protein
MARLHVVAAFAAACAAAGSAAAAAVFPAKTIPSSSAASPPTLSTYFANWAIYHAGSYSYTAADLAPIAGKLKEVR